MPPANPLLSVVLFALLAPLSGFLGASCGESATAREDEALLSQAPPAEARAAFARARELYAKDRPFDAIAEMRQALEVAPDWAEARIALGKLLVTYSDVRFSTATVDRGRLDEAIQHLERACELEPDNVDAVFWAGFALRKADRGPEATRRLESALSLRPGHGLAQKELGLLHAAEGDTQRAIAALERARVLLPKDDEVLFQLGLVLETEERLEEARDAFLAATELNGGHPGPRSRLVWIYRRLGDEQASDRMQAEFDRCRAFGKEMTAASLHYDAHSREPEACLGIAELYRSVGMAEQAILWAERAWRLDQTYEPAIELLRELGKPVLKQEAASE